MANQSSWSRCGAIPSPSSQPFLIWRNSSSRAGTSSGSSKAVCSTDCMRTKRSCRSYLPSPCISTFTESRYRLNATMIASRCWSGTAPVILRPSINCSSKVIRSWSSSGMEPRMRTSAVNSLIRDDAKSNPRRDSFVSRAGVVRDGVTNSIDSPSRRLRHNPIEVAEALFRKMVNHRSVLLGRGDRPDYRFAGLFEVVDERRWYSWQRRSGRLNTYHRDRTALVKPGEFECNTFGKPIRRARTGRMLPLVQTS